MDLDSVRLPPRISMGAVGGPTFNTNIATMASGAESRNQEWELERGQWTVSYSARRVEDWQDFLAFFRIVAGMANTFRFKDWTDYICLPGDGFFVPSISGSPTVLQMVKRYTFGVYTYDRYITKPVFGTITLIGGGTLDYSTGIATGSPTGWYGEFDCCVRLDSDPMKAQVLDRNDEGLLVGWNDIQIVEVTNEAR